MPGRLPVESVLLAKGSNVHLMGRMRRPVLFGILLVLTLFFPAFAEDPGIIEITVKPGQTLSVIAREHLEDPGRWRELLKYNKIDDPNLIKPGMKLRVPGALRRKALARVRSVRPQAEGMRHGSGSWAVLSMGQELFADDSLRTFEKAGVRLGIGGGAEIEIRENSFVVLSEKITGGKPTSASVSLQKGLLRATVDKSKMEGRTFEVQTPSAIAAVRGTDFSLQVPDNGDTTVSCHTGLVGVTAGGKTIEVPAGFGTKVKKGEAPGPLFKLPSPPEVIEPGS